MNAWRTATTTGNERWNTGIRGMPSRSRAKRTRYRPGCATTGSRNLRTDTTTRRHKTGREKLRQAVAEKPDAYRRELAQQFACTKQAVFHMLRNLGITLKKILLVRRAVGGEARAVQCQAEEGSRHKARLHG